MGKMFNEYKISIGNIDCYCSNEEWYLKYIVSELIINFLINNAKDVHGNNLNIDHQFPDWDCWDVLYDDSDDHLEETMYDKEKNRDFPFNLYIDGFIKIAKVISYMLIERRLICPYCSKFDNNFSDNFNALSPIQYYKYYNNKYYIKSTTFKNNNELLNISKFVLNIQRSIMM